MIRSYFCFFVAALRPCQGKEPRRKYCQPSLRLAREKICTHHQHIAQRFEVVPTRLLNTQMSVDRSVTSRAREILVLPVGNVQMRLRVTVLLGETKVDNVDLVAPLPNTHEEVVGLDVAVNEVSGMNVLDTGDKLVGEEEDGLQAELAVAEVEEVLERWAPMIG